MPTKETPDHGSRRFDTPMTLFLLAGWKEVKKAKALRNHVVSFDPFNCEGMWCSVLFNYL